MAEKMMRLAGRSDDGLAKALSVETDEIGNGVLRVVDAAPFAYDPVDDVIKVDQKAYPLERVKYEVTIPAEGNASPELNLDISNFTSMSIGISGGANHAWSVQLMQQDFTDLTPLGRDTFEFTAFEGISGVVPIKASGLRIRIYNKDTASARTYKVYLYLRK